MASILRCSPQKAWTMQTSHRRSAHWAGLRLQGCTASGQRCLKCESKNVICWSSTYQALLLQEENSR